jgi:serpin B
MKDAFDAGRANFAGMSTRPEGLFIDEGFHEAFVDVNEEGTEAAAATALITRFISSVPPPIPVFRADHPFLFLIRDDATGTVLFLGRVVNPHPKG